MKARQKLAVSRTQSLRRPDPRLGTDAAANKGLLVSRPKLAILKYE